MGSNKAADFQGIEPGNREGTVPSPSHRPSVTAKLLMKLKSNFQKSGKDHADWLLDFDGDDEDGPPVARHVPERLDVLCGQTGLERHQLRRLYRAFKEMCPSGAIDETTFRNVFGQLFPVSVDGHSYARYVFNALDRRQTGCVTFSDFVRGLACLVRGSLQERLQWIFRLYDIDRNGEITKDEMSAVIGAIHNLIGPSEEQSEKHTNRAFQKLDLNSDGVITIDEFLTYCYNDEMICKTFERFTGW